MKSLIVLRGATLQGKTSTLNLLQELLLADSRCKVVKSQPHPNGSDQAVIVSAPAGKVGIITFGDPGTEDHVNGLLNDMDAEGVTIIFAASRTRGCVWNLLNDFADTYGYNLISTSPLHSCDAGNQILIEILNTAESTMLASIIDKLSNL